MDMDGLAAASAGMLGLLVGAHFGHPWLGVGAGAAVFCALKWLEQKPWKRFFGDDE